MCNNNLYSRFEGTYRNLCDSIDRLDDSDFPYKEIARGDLGCDLAYLRELINEVRSLERKNRELQADIDRCIGHGGVWAREIIRQTRKEEERLIRKAEENRKNSNTSNALLKPVNSEEKPKAKKHYNDFGEYLDDHPEIVKMAEKYPTMFQERVYEYRMPLKEKLIWIALYTVGIVTAVFVGGVIGSLIKEFI